MLRKTAIAALCALAMSGVAASGPQSEMVSAAAGPALIETDAAAIVAQQNQIRNDAQSRSGRYQDLAAADRERLLRTQERVLERLAGRTKTTELPRIEQVALFNDLEEISGIVNKAEDERMICERTRPIGSNRPVSVCKTVAQRREERENMLNSRGGRDARCPGACPDNGTAGWR